MSASNKRQKREEYRKTHKEEGGSTELPKKKFYRQRAHANPFSDHQLTYPVSPSQMDWSPYYPAFIDPDAKAQTEEGQPTPLEKDVTVADIGCGFGGLLVVLAPMLPDELILGMEIRTQVTEYVQDRISALRAQHAPSTENKKITFPSWAIENDTYKRIPLPASPPPEGTKEYILYGTLHADEAVFSDTEKALKEITNQTEIASYPYHPDIKVWTINLTPTQLSKIRDLPGIQRLTENPIVPSPSDVQGYYNPHYTHLTASPAPTPYQNISVLRANTMKFLPNFFHRSQLSHIFLCFPDPHFKARKHKQRIVSSTLCAEYAFVLRPGGYVWTITDVEDLGTWMRERFAEFGGGSVFAGVEVPEEGGEGEWIDGDDERRWEVGRLVRAIREETEEGKKVSRNGGRKFVGVWRRREDPAWPGESGE